MKRALSFILALTLALTLLPTFAAAVDMEPAELQPTEFSVIFDNDEIDANYLTTTMGLTKHSEKTRWYVVENSKLFHSNWKVITDGSVSTALNGITAKSTTLQYFLSSSNSDYLALSITDGAPGDTLAIEVTAPAAGIYTVAVIGRSSGSGGDFSASVNGTDIGKWNLLDSNTEISAGGSVTCKSSVPVMLNKGANTVKIKQEKCQNGFFGFTFTPAATTQINPNVSFVQTTNVPEYDGITVQTVARGADVALTAHKEEIEGYEFVGWKRGSNDDNSAWIDISGDSYNVWTNTFLTAIYKPTAETATTATVDFWNQNGAYMGTADETSFKEMVVQQPTLTGFGAFQGWFTDGKVQIDENTVLSAGTTNAVAQYDDGVVSGVTLNGNAVTGADTYNEPISLTETGVTYWKRGGEIIAYGDTYNFNVWAGTAITSHSDVVSDKVPVAIIEKNADYNAYMFEYDAGAYTIVEAGIIFGDADATVDSCTKKYTSQRKVSHNQFTVPAETGTAKGYIIWKNASDAYQIDYFTAE